MKITDNPIHCSEMEFTEIRHKLADNFNSMGNTRTSNGKVIQPTRHLSIEQRIARGSPSSLENLTFNSQEVSIGLASNKWQTKYGHLHISFDEQTFLDY